MNWNGGFSAPATLSTAVISDTMMQPRSLPCSLFAFVDGSAQQKRPSSVQQNRFGHVSIVPFCLSRMPRCVARSPPAESPRSSELARFMPPGPGASPPSSSPPSLLDDVRFGVARRLTALRSGIGSRPRPRGCPSSSSVPRAGGGR